MIEESVIAELFVSLLHPHGPVPNAGDSAAIQLIRLAIAFRITFCSFIIRSSFSVVTVSGLVAPQVLPLSLDRTTHVLIGQDN
jgi:hypothetical protein